MIRRDIILIGAGGHAASCIDVIEQEGSFQIVGIVAGPEETRTEVLGYPILGTDEKLPNLQRTCKNAAVCIGQIKDWRPRMETFLGLRKLGFNLPSILAPTAHVASSAIIGRGVMVFHGAVVNSRANIGDNTIINTGAIIEHDAKTGSHCHISTGTILNGGVLVGDCTFIGSGTTVRNGMSIGSRVIIGMGCKIWKDVPNGTLLR